MNITYSNVGDISSKKVGNLIRQLRIEKNMSQEMLGSLLFVTRKCVSKWETGCALPSISVFQGLSEIFDVSINELINGELLTREHNKNNNTMALKTKSKSNFLTIVRLSIACLLLTLATIEIVYPVLEKVFATNISDYIQGLMYGIGITFELITLYKFLDR